MRRGCIRTIPPAEVVARRRALYSEQPAARPERNFMFYDKLVLPLSGDGTHINMLFCGADALASTPALRAGRFREVWDDPVER
jgi:hypothetical protein